MDLSLVPKVSRWRNLQIMSKVSLYGGKSIKQNQEGVFVYRVNRWTYTPVSKAQLSSGETTTTIETTEGENPNAQSQPAKTVNEQGSWNIDGEILPQPSDKSLHFRLHPRLINYFGRELDLDDPRYVKCLCCKKAKRSSNLVVIG